jgi:hypothetical protein
MERPWASPKNWGCAVPLPFGPRRSITIITCRPQFHNHSESLHLWLYDTRRPDGGPIFSMYLEKAQEEDKRTAEGWKEEAEKVFLFVSV